MTDAAQPPQIARLHPLREAEFASILAVGFGAAVLMWAIGYIAHLPGFQPSSQFVFGLLILALIVAGFFAGRIGGVSRRAAVLAGALAGTINLLIVGSLLGGKNRDQLLPRELLQNAALWSFSTIVVCGLGVGLGRLLAGVGRRHGTEGGQNWTFRFALIGCIATLLLISVGGVVTGFEAGLAVPDWPNTYGYNMFLFPLSKMTGGIYYEHSHRLFGALVGLTMLTLTIHLWRTESRRWVKIVASGLLAIVIAQGLLGALRVTGKFTLSQEPGELAPNLALAVVHGVLAQVYFCGLLVLTAALSTRWRGGNHAIEHESAATDRGLGFACIAIVLLQLILGALLRHFTYGLQYHLALAAVVVITLGAFSIRVWSLYEIPPLSRIGATLVGLILVQLLLGFAALAATYVDGTKGTHPLQVIVTTLHQTTGALVLGLTVLSMAWHLRLVCPAGEAETGNDAIPTRP